MRRGKGEPFIILNWRRFLHAFLVFVFVFVLFISFEGPELLNWSSFSDEDPELYEARRSSIAQKDSRNPRFQDSRDRFSNSANTLGNNSPFISSSHEALRARHTWKHSSDRNSIREYGRIPRQIREMQNGTRFVSALEKMASDAWQVGLHLWTDMHHNKSNAQNHSSRGIMRDSCPHSIFLSEKYLQKNGMMARLPCGLMLGSSITVVGTPLPGHVERLVKAYRSRHGPLIAIVSQFIVELEGQKIYDTEDPPRILHVNPRLKGDWSGKSIFEVNTCYRGQWGTAQRCNGVESQHDDTVDGLLRCEKWNNEDEESSKDTKSSSWLDRLMGIADRPNMEWHYPFSENESFVFTIRAGWEGYHMTVDGRHIASSPYRVGFSLEEAASLTVKGDIQLHSIVATSLRLSHPSLSPDTVLELNHKWKVPLQHTSVDFFIGILSSSNHFSERMAIRKTWLQSKSIQTAKVLARFFVALHASIEVDLQLKEEADFYGDVIIVPFLDRYELLVLKTVAICEYALRNTSATYIMKCDDDNFVRVETVLEAVKAAGHQKGLYMGNINLDHRPLRVGKWAVTYEEWPEGDYPPYANGPGYIITRDIASFIVSEKNNNTLRLFKMEDVSMGMWVVHFNALHQVHYQHSWKFCQFGCINDYYTAHYQLPKQMFCMWEKLKQGKAECCNA
ncbi:hypothetical protein KP509_30G010900 [Ceratopteris richardii]|uniref:Galectin domain-containing protein n=1 Tax=Ceratopteris richardii TaxID=49495 RepID=A0A8T2R0Y1_CERRI|nr:hypothetical protein KP509_30G010900 [Ceratopteris richardii]